MTFGLNADALEEAAKIMLICAEGDWEYIKRCRNPKSINFDNGSSYNYWMRQAERTVKAYLDKIDEIQKTTKL